MKRLLNYKYTSFSCIFAILYLKIFISTTKYLTFRFLLDKITCMQAIEFKNKYGPYALVAGASYGLGFAFSEAVAKRGLNLIMIARGKERLESSAQLLRDIYNIEVITISEDLANYEVVKAQVDALDVAIGLLIYNAASCPIGKFNEKSDKDLIHAADINIKGPLLYTRLLCPKMIERKKGGIVLMASLAGTVGSPNIATYAATKAFNANLAEGLWKELKPYGIDVIGSCAGAILTENYKEAEKAKKAPGALEPSVVAEKTLNALNKNKPILVPGGTSKVARFLFMRLMSRKSAVNTMAKSTKNLS